MTRILIAGAVSAFALTAASFAMAEDRSAAFDIGGASGSRYEIMSPSNGLSLSLGSKKVIAVFETKDDWCHLKLVVADAAGGNDTRIVVPVMSGNAVQVDTPARMSANYACHSAGTRIDARVLEQSPYKS